MRVVTGVQMCTGRRLDRCETTLQLQMCQSDRQMGLRAALCGRHLVCL
jgi:hypothetical protein